MAFDPACPRTLDTLTFDNRFTRELPADPQPANFRRQVAQACFSRVQPTPVPRPTLVAYAHEVAQLLDLPAQVCTTPQFAAVFAGNGCLPAMDPHAMCYGGHQFGSWAGQLGDGRAIILGEVVNGRGEHWALQLKGAGPTPYSRSADGLAVLRSSVREFLCSEAMFHLGVPTTRALCLLTTGNDVVRDMFYDGRPRAEPGAIVCRVAPSFTRFGNFELLAARGDHALLKQLLDFTLRTDFAHLGEPSAATYLAWLHEVCVRTATLVVHWQRVGFVHGVMNTDNMSVLGLTIDYGPYGWLEDYNPDWTPNTTDAAGRRYRYGNQPQIAQWNLFQLAEAIFPLIGDVERMQAVLQVYAETFNRGWQTMMAGKLGLQAFDALTDPPLVKELQEVLALTETDMTVFYRRLATVPCAQQLDSTDETLIAPLMDAYYDPQMVSAGHTARMAAWLRLYAERVRVDGTDDDTRRERMNRVNPNFVLRNYLAQQAIDRAEQGDFTLVQHTLEVLRRPYDEQPERQAFAAKRPEWARNRPGCSMLSCSS
ncbi:MAG: YdiU family protein [Myxococcales bacterium]|nr:YdiU family protein [Myxococcales bacterium]